MTPPDLAAARALADRVTEAWSKYITLPSSARPDSFALADTTRALADEVERLRAAPAWQTIEKARAVLDSDLPLTEGLALLRQLLA